MIAERLLALQTRFIDRSRGDAAALQGALADAEPDREVIRAVAHRLAGGGGTVGLPDVSVAAAALEDACDAGDAAAVRRAVGDLCAILDRLTPSPPRHRADNRP